MSGIAAIVNFDNTPINSTLLDQMVRQMAYRGPDGQSTWVNNHIGLGHALYRTHNGDIEQPFSLQHIVVTAHVRIDARADLIPRLRAAGIDAAIDAPDIELLAKAYLAWGEACLDFLLGDFVFVIWDAQKQRLFAARDRFGTQPLFYAHIGTTLIISTELSAIRLHPLVSSRLNELAIGDFLVLQGVNRLDKTLTIFADINRLAPAHCFVTGGEPIKPHRYWLPVTDEPMLRYRNEDEYVEHFLDVFKQAVKDRIRAKQTVIQISGGLDSTSIAAIASQLVRSGEVDTNLRAVTMVYDRIQPDTEAYYVSLVARKLDLPVEYFPCDAYQITQPLPLLAEPAVVYPSGLRNDGMQAISSLGRLALAGHGGDEILRFSPFIDILRGMPFPAAANLLLWQWRFLGRRPQGLLRDVVSLRPKHKQRRNTGLGVPDWLNPDFEQRFNLADRYQALVNWTPAQRHPLHPNAYQAILWPDYQMTGETLAQPPTAPFDTACPFLDPRVVRFILTLPPQPWFYRKYLLRRAMRGLLPDAILSRIKTTADGLLDNLLRLPSAQWIDTWTPLPELEPYIRREAIPPLTGDAARKRSLVDIRPVMLNEWLRSYRDF